eukprot:gene3773-4296_t
MQTTEMTMLPGNNNSNLQNHTNPSFTYEYQPGYHTVLLVIAVCIILHNFVVLYLYLKVKNLHNATNTLLVNLSCADFLTGFLLIPFLIASATFYGRDVIVLYFVSNVISDFITIAIVFSLLLVTLERYLALCYPYFHPNIATKWMSKASIATLWCLAFIIAIIPLSWSYPLLAGDNEDPDTFYKYYSPATLICCFFIPSGLMLYCLVNMFMIINRLIRQDTTRGLSVRSGRRSQRKAVFVFLAMYINLLVCWSPLMLIRLMIDIKRDLQPPAKLLEILVALRCCSSLLNPAIYVWCKRDFKIALHKRLFAKFRKNNNNSPSYAPANGTNEDEPIKDTLM